MYTRITMQTAKSMLDADPSIVVIDVRTQDEFDSGHIPGAISIPYEEIANKAPKMIGNREAKIFVNCSSGFRSRIASLTLIKMGYTNVFDIGSIREWRYSLAR